MNRFAELLDALVFTPSRNGKLRLLRDHFAEAGDPERGWALAALTGAIDLPTAKPAMVRALVAERVDPELFAWSYDFVGDLAETAALIWPAPPVLPALRNSPPLTLAAIVAELSAASRAEVPALVAGWLDTLDATGRWALLKLVTGGLRVGVSERLAKTAVAALAPPGGVTLDDVEEVWHGLVAPYEALFAWVEGRGERPDPAAAARFRPMMLSHPLEDADLEVLVPAEFAAEWKWDGIRVQIAATAGEKRLFSRTGEDVGGAFPDILAGIGFTGVLDGELLVVRDEAVAPFADLQQRLNRKAVGAKLLASHPAWIRLYDILLDGDEDVRALPFDQRRRRLEDWYALHRPARMDLSPLIPFRGWDELVEIRAGARAAAIEGLMLKRRGSPYLAGRPKGHWYKWKRDPLAVDCVLMYAQRGHGKRSSFYSDYTFGLWTEGNLVPVGKAYFGFTDEELQQLDRWVRNHTTRRYGPVREVEAGLVLEIVFDGVQRSTRHKSGLAMRFPRVSRIRWDKPAAEADRLEVLAAMLP
ncbi:DNA ligase-1 [Stella humosa]|uniref:DNA ligase (ATP) n=1 Tax=Stella humosa TaxID=94 RepID=A0A3N1KXZ3_9PROT|nr:cisplatin damage response ATP-dependent DNA ligase [Stella humosa]ROP83659.1 DNA ligase-1 [Stella humosa]BBK33068.1 ATP-dependent DNA ligase [Stella humosa]